MPVLTPDCSACAALCCMAMAFDKGEDFALDKPALHPCPNLSACLCVIHDRLQERGFPGCAAYDCLGAGQRVTQEVFGGLDWQQDATLRRPMAEAFAVLRRLHAGLELLQATAALSLPAPLATQRADLLAAFHPAAGWSRQSLADLDLPALETRLRAFLGALRAHV